MARKPFTRFMLDDEVGANVKAMRLTDAEFRAWICGVLAIASRCEVRGAFMVGRSPATAEDVCNVSRKTSRRTAEATLRKLREMGMLEHDSALGGEWVHDFDLLNPAPKVDRTHAQRQARYRERQRMNADSAGESDGVTGASRDGVTDAMRDVSRNGDMKVEVEVEAPIGSPVADATSEVSRIDDVRKRLQTDQVDRVWDAYLKTRAAVLGPRSTPKLTPERRTLISRRLRQYPEADVLAAVTGWRHFAHNRGENDRGTPFCDLELVLRINQQTNNLERFRDAETSAGVSPAADVMAKLTAPPVRSAKLAEALRREGIS